MDNESLMELFDEVARLVREALATVTDWGPSGHRSDQYNHDVVADGVALDRLHAAGVGVLSEETGLSDAASGVIVVIDPVDGSTNASSGLPWYAISLCAVRSGQCAVALVSNLATGETWRATEGMGATHNGQPFTVKDSPTVALADSIVAFSGYPGSNPGWRQFRVLGACALDMCTVASGGLDGFADCGDAHGVWDYLGAKLILEEAGGVCVDAFGRDLVILDHTARRAPIAARDSALVNELVAARITWS